MFANHVTDLEITNIIKTRFGWSDHARLQTVRNDLTFLSCEQIVNAFKGSANLSVLLLLAIASIKTNPRSRELLVATQRLT